MPAPNPVALVRLGGIAGLATCAVYPVLVFAPLPRLASVVLASAMGPLLGAASFGLRTFLSLDRRRTSADLAAAANALAGALLTAMLLVQLAVKSRSTGRPSQEIVSIWLGLDVAWDLYLGAGTLLFGLAAFGHPRLGRLWGGAGILVAVLLLAFNLWTFPAPPADAGLADLGPLTGLWYLTVSIRMLLSNRWVREAC